MESGFMPRVGTERLAAAHRAEKPGRYRRDAAVRSRNGENVRDVARYAGACYPTARDWLVRPRNGDPDSWFGVKREGRKESSSGGGLEHHKMAGRLAAELRIRRRDVADCHDTEVDAGDVWHRQQGTHAAPGSPAAGSRTTNPDPLRTIRPPPRSRQNSSWRQIIQSAST